MARIAALKLNQEGFLTSRLKRYDGEFASPVFIYRSPKVGVLLLHGFTATPGSMRQLAEYLAERNITVFAPLIAGHGSSLDDLASSGISDWQQSVVDSSLALKEVVEKVYIVGSSLGGNLAFYLATQYSDLCNGIISVGTPIRVHWQRVFKTALNTYGYFKKYQKKSWVFYPRPTHQSASDFDPVMPVSSVRNLFKFIKEITMPNLHLVNTPTLIVQSLKDPVVHPASARYIYQNLGTENKKILWLKDRNHTLSGTDRKEGQDDIVFENVYKFIAEN